MECGYKTDHLSNNNKISVEKCHNGYMYCTVWCSFFGDMIYFKFGGVIEQFGTSEKLPKGYNVGEINPRGNISDLPLQYRTLYVPCSARRFIHK